MSGTLGRIDPNTVITVFGVFFFMVGMFAGIRTVAEPPSGFRPDRIEHRAHLLLSWAAMVLSFGLLAYGFIEASAPSLMAGPAAALTALPIGATIVATFVLGIMGLVTEARANELRREMTTTVIQPRW